MRIMHLITGLKIGGAESVLYNLLAHSKWQGDEHTVCYFYKGVNVERIESLGITTRHIKGIVSPYDPLGIIALVMFVYKYKPDLIHSSLWSANILARCIAFFFRTPVVSDLHNPIKYLGTFRSYLEWLTLKGSSKLIAVSPSVRSSFYNYCSLSETKKPQIEIIFNSVDVDSLHQYAQIHHRTRGDIQYGEHDFVFGVVGRLVPVKNIDVLLNALSLLNLTMPAARVVIVGEGPQREHLKMLAQELKISHKVRFTGEVTSAAPFYPLFDCFVLPSGSEGLSIALLEACAFGLPLITTGYDRKHDFVEHGINGLVVKPYDHYELAEAMIRLFHSEEMREVMKRQNRMLAKKQFDIKNMVAAYTRVFHEFEKSIKLESK